MPTTIQFLMITIVKARAFMMQRVSRLNRGRAIVLSATEKISHNVLRSVAKTVVRTLETSLLLYR